MPQSNLFEELGEEYSSKKTALQLAIKSSKILSKEQKKFNKLSKNIIDLELEIEQLEVTIQKLMATYVKEINPLKEEEARAFIRAAFSMDQFSFEYKFSKKTKEQIEDLVVVFMDNALEVVVPNEEEQALYDRYNERTYEEEKEAQLNELRFRMQQMFSDQYDMDVDMSEVNMESPEELARFQKEMQEKIKNHQEELTEKSKKSKRKKSTKQLEKEILEKAKLEAQKKDLKSIYLSLSKALHPDTETDPDVKLEKEELMKRVTYAYQNKDFPQLLLLELEWVHKTSDRLNELSEQQLSVYNSMLQDRVNELNNKRISIIYNPHFEAVSSFATLNERTAVSRILSEKKKLNERLKFFEKNLNSLSKIKNKKVIAHYVDLFHDEFVPLEFDWLFD